MPPAYYNRGAAYAKLDQRERATEDYDKAIELDPNLAEEEPGFEATFAIAGLLAVITYTILRRGRG